MSTLGRITKTVGAVTKADNISTRQVGLSTYRGGSDFYFFGADGVDIKFSFNGHESSLKAYRECGPLTSIINRKAQAHINGQTFVMTVGGKGKGKESTGEAANKLRKLMAKPNPLQSWKQFRAQQKIYMQLFGFSIVLPIMSVGFESRGPIDATSLWNIPPYLVDIEESNALFYQSNMNGIVKAIRLRYRDSVIPLLLDRIYVFKDFTPSMETLAFPESRVRSNAQAINNIIGAMESRGELISYAGSQGIISPDAGSGQYVPMAIGPKEKSQLHADFKTQYGIRKGQFRYIISPAAIKWQSMSVKTKDLMLIEEVVESTKSLCDAYGYPPHLLGIINPTFNNQAAAEKGFYQNTIIPESESMDEEWNNFFRLPESDLNIRIETDFSHLPILQEDEKSKAEARKARNEALIIEFQNNMLTLNRWLELNGEDTIPDGDKYYYQLVQEGWKFGASGNTQSKPNDQQNGDSENNQENTGNNSGNNNATDNNEEEEE
jgi:hypothetical protein